MSWGKAAIASAIASARATCSPAATRSVTRPKRSASSTSITRPEIVRSSARPLPTIRGSRCVPPSIRGTPKRRSVKPKRALGVATRRSHHSASSKPPARHQPETAAIVGFGDASRVKPSGPSGRSSRGPSVSSAFRSAPAQNASSPPPVTTSTRAPSSATNERNASCSASAVGPSIALRRSGRSIVTSAAAPARS